jgi:hypothetical protein
MLWALFDPLGLSSASDSFFYLQALEPGERQIKTSEKVQISYWYWLLG